MRARNLSTIISRRKSPSHSVKTGLCVTPAARNRSARAISPSGPTYPSSFLSVTNGPRVQVSIVVYYRTSVTACKT